jgi:hypothetical protein
MERILQKLTTSFFSGRCERWAFQGIVLMIKFMGKSEEDLGTSFIIGLSVLIYAMIEEITAHSNCSFRQRTRKP